MVNRPPRSLSIPTVTVMMCLLLTAPAQAATFCERVLDAFDFTLGVFAGPDPDALPDLIFTYIESKARDRMDAGKLSEKKAGIFLESVENDLKLPSQIARRCKRDPHAGWEVVDALIVPRLESGAIHHSQVEEADAEARDQLMALGDACMAFLMESGGDPPCSLEFASDKRHTPVPIQKAPEIDLLIRDGTLDHFEATARHQQGSRTWHMDATGKIIGE